MDKFAGGLSIVIVQHLQPEEAPPPGTPMLFFRDVMSFLCGGVAVGSGVLVCILWLIRFYKSKTNEHREFGSKSDLATSAAPMGSVENVSSVENASVNAGTGRKSVSFIDRRGNKTERGIEWGYKNGLQHRCVRRDVQKQVRYEQRCVQYI